MLFIFELDIIDFLHTDKDKFSIFSQKILPNNKIYPNLPHANANHFEIAKLSDISKYSKQLQLFL